jgi:hypothetical protein
MRFILGILVGAAVTIGAAYVHDTQMAKPGPTGVPQTYVNWDNFSAMFGGR